MSTTSRCASRLVLAAAMLMLFVPGAWAFYPFGFFDETLGGELVIIKWPLSAFDTNDDGDVSGADEGVVLNFEIGNGTDGFDATEVSKVLSGFTEWELVTTSFVAFQRGQNITDPVELTADLSSIDAFNIVVFESEADVAEQGGSLVLPQFIFSFIANSFEDTFITVGNSTFPVSGGQMIDIDTVVGANARDREAQEGNAIRGLATLGAGTFLGLGYSPLSNIDVEASETAERLLEDRVVAIRNADGTIGLRGVTPTMANVFVSYNDGGNNFVDSVQDLAPDDIAGITFMYPRTDQDLFFNLNQRARTNAGNNQPSQPIGGGWIRAWCDADNNPATARVPMFDTLTGLYYNGIDTNFRGHFQLKGILKQLETLSEQAFTATYAVSCSEFLPLFSEGDARSQHDTTHGGFNGGSIGDGGIVFDSLFPAEVFNENGNLFGLSAVNQGTPLVFDLISRKIISQTSGKTLDVLLATGRPMFGDQDQTCPLNVIVGPVDPGTEALTALRSMRDKTLLNSALGTAVADVYYRVAPSAAQFLVRHAGITAAAQWLVAPVRWVVVNAEWMLLATTLLLGTLLARQRTLRARAVAALLLVGALAFALPAANANVLPDEISDYLAQSDDVVVGSVTEVESRWINNNTKIITDIAIRIGETVKGTQNAGGVVHLQLPTGRVGAIGRSSPQLPTFKVGEEVLVFLDAQKKGYYITGGIAGKYLIAPHPKTGEKYVFATSMPGHTRLEREIAKMHQQKAPDGIEFANTKGPMKIDFEHRTLVKLDEFVSYLRDLGKRQEKQTLASSEVAEQP